MDQLNHAIKHYLQNSLQLEVETRDQGGSVVVQVNIYLEGELIGYSKDEFDK